MSQKTSYKAKVQEELILQEFKKALDHGNHWYALTLIEANCMISLEKFNDILVEEGCPLWTIAQLRNLKRF